MPPYFICPSHRQILSMSSPQPFHKILPLAIHFTQMFIQLQALLLAWRWGKAHPLCVSGFNTEQGNNPWKGCVKRVQGNITCYQTAEIHRHDMCHLHVSLVTLLTSEHIKLLIAIEPDYTWNMKNTDFTDVLCVRCISVERDPRKKGWKLWLWEATKTGYYNSAKAEHSNSIWKVLKKQPFFSNEKNFLVSVDFS